MADKEDNKYNDAIDDVLNLIDTLFIPPGHKKTVLKAVVGLRRGS